MPYVAGMPAGRRTLLADAAIAVLARDGARGLTHHAVDDEAQLARGSTSYYCRTRAQLLSLTLQRIVALDLEDVHTHAGEPGSRALARLVAHWLGPARPRTVARLELFLTAGRDAALREELQAVTRAFSDVAGAAADPMVVFAVVDGLLLSHVRLDLPAPDPAELERRLAPFSTVVEDAR